MSRWSSLPIGEGCSCTVSPATSRGIPFIQPLTADGAPEGAPSQLTRQHFWLNGLGFAPDGASVLFSGVREHAQALWRVSIASPDTIDA